MQPRVYADYSQFVGVLAENSKSNLTTSYWPAESVPECLGECNYVIEQYDFELQKENTMIPASLVVG